MADEPPLTGVADARMASLDALLIKFVTEYHVPGASLAVAREGRLVYARGCGYADVEQKLPVQPRFQFRIASLTKPLTSVAILQLVEQEKLNLDACILDFLPELVPLTAAERDAHPWRKITVQQCLQHLGGWDGGKSFDPMFRGPRIARTLNIPSPPLASDVIRFMAKQPLDFQPGERYVYSNFGYNVLGRVIEKVSGRTYEEYVKEQIWQRVGAKSPRLGKTLLKNRAKDEVLYYEPGEEGKSVFAENQGQEVPGPYGRWSLEMMDAHGGWISSAPDLVRFTSGLDQSSRTPLLKPETRKLMIHCRPEGAAGHEKDGKPGQFYYGMGWGVRLVGDDGKAFFWHHGSLDGSSTLLLHHYDDISWAILFNTRHEIEGKSPSILADTQLHPAIGAIKEWPEVDLFPTIENGQ